MTPLGLVTTAIDRAAAMRKLPASLLLAIRPQ
jgi:hypothetical protein